MRWFSAILVAMALLFACGKKAAGAGGALAPVEVTVMTVARATRRSATSTSARRRARTRCRSSRASTASSTSASTPKAAWSRPGEVMFRQDPKPFQAQLDAAKGALAEQQARLQVAQRQPGAGEAAGRAERAEPEGPRRRHRRRSRPRPRRWRRRRPTSSRRSSTSATRRSRRR